VFGAVSAFQLTCDYSKDDAWTEIGNIYYCFMDNDAEMTLSGRAISKVIGSHASNKDEVDVAGFWNQNRKMVFFPSNLHDKFPNLFAIGIDNCGISEIHKEDLKPFGDELLYFRLSKANLQMIEKDLFIHNPNLKVVGLHHNKIKRIDKNVFDNLKSLNQLWLSENNCINKDAEKHEDVEFFINEIRTTCSP
jgi:hypothetical protein